MNSLLSANLRCIQQGIDLLDSLPGPAYARPCREVFGSTIGGHIRHNLDHYAALLEGVESGNIDYDARERDPAVEEDPRAARALMAEIGTALLNLGSRDLDGSLKIRMHDGGDSAWSRTSLRRELQFLLSHTIHHHALIVAIATRYGHTQFPEGFGVAPSTLHNQNCQEA